MLRSGALVGIMERQLPTRCKRTLYVNIALLLLSRSKPLKVRMIVAPTLIVFSLMIAAQPSYLVAGETVVDEVSGFTLVLPKGLVSDPELINATPNFVYGFVLGDTREDDLDIVLLIRRLQDTPTGEELRSNMPPDFQGRIFTTPWQGLEIAVVAVREQHGETMLVTYNVMIPLKRAAIGIRIVGPADRESELQRLLEETLAGLKADSNLNQSAAPSRSKAPSRIGKTKWWTIIAVIVLGGLVVLWMISRNAPRGTVLVIAAFFWFGGTTPNTTDSMEMFAVTAGFKLLGTAGGILGLVDLFAMRRFRNRNPRDPNTT